MLLQKQQIKRNLKHPLFVLDFNNFDFLPLNYPPDQRSWLLKKQAKAEMISYMELKGAEKQRAENILRNTEFQRQ